MITIFINEPQVKAVKSDLLHHSRGNKLVKSSCLTEALACAFGFHTNAAMLESFKIVEPPLCVEFSAERFWVRLSELEGVFPSELQSEFCFDLPKSVYKAIGIRDLRETITLSSAFINQLDKFFKLMASQGAAYFVVGASRIPNSFMGIGTSYRGGRGAMRPCFTPEKPSDLWQWDNSSWSALLADDFLVDNPDPERDLLRWASKAHKLLEPNLRLGDVEFNAKIGLVVKHEVIENCTETILYQRPGQREDVLASDALHRDVIEGTRRDLLDVPFA